MKYRALTVSREYGSGGGEIADIIAKELGWRLVDKDLIAEIGRDNGLFMHITLVPSLDDERGMARPRAHGLGVR